ncbi:RidA family protein [Herbiconiux sp. CPCC 205763]|uniref:RidA family protein n=1 Tax=Herbiconiux aconitum TaxID=2970913 RepID=A0ABT2GNH1_9MICO|nr:RidA family protein [Herbiconiux aconitum]MCS5717764.1 RidA family protein [Herbiconiux aconitum]
MLSDPIDRPEDILSKAGKALPAISAPAATYVAVKVAGDMAYVSGHGPLRDGSAVFTGKLGRDYSVEQGKAAAALTMLSLLASVKAEIGELDRVIEVVKLLVLVNATDDFSEHHLVADGASELLIQLFGDAGLHARSAIGVSSLPFGIATEIEAIFRID